MFLEYFSTKKFKDLLCSKFFGAIFCAVEADIFHIMLNDDKDGRLTNLILFLAFVARSNSSESFGKLFCFRVCSGKWLLVTIRQNPNYSQAVDDPRSHSTTCVTCSHSCSHLDFCAFFSSVLNRTTKSAPLQALYTFNCINEDMVLNKNYTIIVKKNN